MLSKEYQEAAKRAHCCDIAERYEDMAEEMKNLIKMCHENNQEITVSIRNSFSMAFKNLVGARRSSWRVLYSEKQKMEEKQSDEVHIVDDLLSKVEGELLKYCDEVLQIIDNYILPDIASKPVACAVFFYKMKGDYYRYKAEVLSGNDEKEASDLALGSYQEAQRLSKDLNPTDPIRLGLYLNFSVFNYEILNNTEEACKIARSAFDAAISELDTVSEDYYKDSTLIMQLIRDNLALWTTNPDTDVEKHEDAEREVA